jgi:type I restriction enzyme M protein
MSSDTKHIVNKAWNFATVLWHDGVSHLSYTEEITFLLFLKMADELTRPPYDKLSLLNPKIPAEYSWATLLNKDGEELKRHYDRVLQALSRQPGALGNIFKRAKSAIEKPETLRRLIVDLIEPEKWVSMDADVKGDIYEGLIEKSMSDAGQGAGQYFTPRSLIKAIVDCTQPTAADIVCDPAAGTGGFLIGAYDYVLKHQGKELDKDQKKHLRTNFVRAWELVPNTARLCIMNLYLHGIDDTAAVRSGTDSLLLSPSEGDKGTLVLTNPPFGKKSTLTILNDAGEVEKEDASYERQDFWTTTKNKQLNFLQHVKTLLKVNGRCAIVVPDNVLFEGGAGEKVRTNLLRQFDVHTLLRLPTGIFYAQGVKANVLFFDAKPAREQPWTTRLWVYDLRTNMHFTLKTNPLKRADLDEFVECYRPEKRHLRKPTWTEATPDGRWRAFEYDDLVKRDKVSLDIFWLKDKSLEDSDDLPKPDVLADEIADDLETALEQFQAISAKLKGRA